MTEYEWFRSHLKTARVILIVATLVQGSFISGASGGIGGQVAEVALMVMTQRGMDALLSTKVQWGGDSSVAAAEALVAALMEMASVGK